MWCQSAGFVFYQQILVKDQGKGIPQSPPFEAAYKSGAVDQLEGQMASLKVQLSRLATKESFWVFSGNDFNLKVSDKKDPSYLIIANNPKTQKNKLYK